MRKHADNPIVFKFVVFLIYHSLFKKNHREPLIRDNINSLHSRQLDNRSGQDLFMEAAQQVVDVNVCWIPELRQGSMHLNSPKSLDLSFFKRMVEKQRKFHLSVGQL